MYIKVVVKNNVTYYILSLYDRTKSVWCSRIIDEKVANALLSVGVKKN